MSETAPITETPEDTETPDAPEAPRSLSDLTEDELSDLASNPEGLAKYAEATEEPAEEPTEEATEEPAEEPTEATRDADDIPDRVRLNTLSRDDAKLVNAAVQMVRANPAMSIGQAMAAISHSPLPPQEEIAPSRAELSPIEEAQSEVADIRAQLKEAKENYETDKDLELTEKLLDAKVKLFAAQGAEANAQLAAETAFEAERQESISKAIDLYPDSGRPGTAFYAAVQAEVARFAETNPDFLRDPNFPLAIAGLVGGRHGVAPAFAAPRSNNVSVRPVAQPTRSARPASIPLLGGNASRDISSDRESVFRQVEAIRDLEDLETLADAVGSIKSTKLTA